MLGRVTVPILPYRRRDGYSQPVQRGARVTVYNAMGDGSAAVGENGVVQPTATTAYVYRNRTGSTLMPNPYTCDEFGGPDDDGQPGVQQANFSFFGFPGVYHLRVLATDGSAFGIPFVRVPFDPLKWDAMNISELYNNTASTTFDNDAYVNKQFGTDCAPDHNNSGGFEKAIAIKSAVGAANSGAWVGEQMVTNGSEEGFGDYIGANSAALGGLSRLMVIKASQYIDVSANITSGQITGLAMGAATASPIPASPTQPLFMLYADWSALTYNLYIAKGNTTASTTLALTGVDIPADPNLGAGGRLDRLEIRYNPNAFVLEAWVNGAFGGRITDPTKFPARTFGAGGKVYGYNVFAHSGSNAGGNISAAWWNCRYWVGMP